MTPTSQDPEPQLIDLHEFLRVVRRRRFSILLVTILVVALAMVLVEARTPMYSSVSRVEVRPLIAGGDLQSYYFDLVSNMDTEAQRVTSRNVASRAAIELGQPVDATGITVEQLDVLTREVSASIPANTTYIDITCTALQAVQAQACADAFAKAFVEDRADLARSSADAARQGVQAEIDASGERIRALEERLASTSDPRVETELRDEIEAEERAIDAAHLQLLTVPTASPSPALVALPASLPDRPSNKDYLTTGLLAAVVGLSLGLALAFVRERLDERLSRRENVEAAIGAPVLAVVPRVSSWRTRADARLVTVDAPDSVSAEAYRTARTTLLYLATREDVRVIVVTSPGEGDGKTTTTANLAITLAQAGKRVIAVSADLRKPRLHRFFALEGRRGLTEVLQGKSALREVISATMLPNLKVVSSGVAPPNPAELLASPQMRELVRQLRSLADIVLIDTPPPLAVADALELAPISDGIILVIDGSKTTRQAAIHLRHQLERVGGMIMGGILNNLDPGRDAPYGRYYRSQESNYRKPTRRARREEEPMDPSPVPEHEVVDWWDVDRPDPTAAADRTDAAGSLAPAAVHVNDDSVDDETVSRHPDVAEWR